MKILVVLSIFIALSSTMEENKQEEESVFIETARLGVMLLRHCLTSSLQMKMKSGADVFINLQQCLKNRSLLALNRIASRKVIDFPYGIQLVNENNVQENMTFVREVRTNGVGPVNEWMSKVLKKIREILHTHVLKLPMDNKSTEIFEGRRRRKQDTMPLMLFGIMAMAIIAIPMGFQFLAVLGGKALLLAKLALILTSIQGLKKIATSGVNYGFYQHSPHKPWMYDRRYHTGPDHHSYEGGFDVPDQQIDSPYNNIRPRISQEDQN